MSKKQSEALELLVATLAEAVVAGEVDVGQLVGVEGGSTDWRKAEGLVAAFEDAGWSIAATHLSQQIP